MESYLLNTIQNSFSKGILLRSHEQLVKIFMLICTGWD